MDSGSHTRAMAQLDGPSSSRKVPVRGAKGTARLRRIFSFMFPLAFLACSSTSVGSEPLRIPVTIHGTRGDVVIHAEIADTPAARARGLMHRASLGANEGMLFLFPEEGALSFWMKNTLIPLDMIFIAKDRAIVGIIESAPPETTTSRSVAGKSQFVLEVNGGASKMHGIAAGQTVVFVAPIPTE